MEALVREDDGFRRHVECADRHLTKRLADVLERRDQESQDRKRSRQGKEQAEGMEISNRVFNQKWQNKLNVVQIQETC